MDFSQMPGKSRAESELKLRVEMVPSQLWGENLRAVLTRTEWNRLRDGTLQKEGLKCSVCGREAESRDLNCDEVWKYDRKAHVATLVGLRIVCRVCHLVKHLGKAALLAFDGRMEFTDLVLHFMSVNDCNYATFERHLARTNRKEGEHPRRKWRVDFGEFKAQIQAMKSK